MMHDLSLQVIAHMLMLAWLGADVMLHWGWARNGTPPRVLETAAIRIAIAAAITLSLVTLAWSPGVHGGEGYECHAGSP